MRTVPHGAWPSPLSPDALAGARVSVSTLLVADDGSWWWSESRPEEGGRQVVVRRDPRGTTAVVSPDGVSVRSRVHEYGGVAFTLLGDSLVYVSVDDGALWAWQTGDSPAGPARRLSPEPPPGEEHRHAEPRAVPGAPWVLTVRERHHAGGVDDEIVAVPGDGGDPVVLVAGRDFCAAPRPHPGGTWLAYLVWDLPDMPWDGSELWAAPLSADERAIGLGSPVRVAGGRDESVGQPTWAPDGSLVFVSDRAGWWQPYRWSPPAPGAPPAPLRRLCDEEAEFHAPDWALGQATLVPRPAGELVCRFRRDGRDRIGVVDATGALREVSQPCVSISAVADIPAGGRDDAGAVAVIGATPAEPVALRRVELAVTRAGTTGAGSGEAGSVVHRPRAAPLGADWVSAGEAMAFPTASGEEAHLLYFAPRAPGITGPPGVAPPLVVGCHGGPTGAAEAGFDLGVQLWTTRGIAVALVDYRGSSGYGRAYRERLGGAWGVADAEDCMAAATFLARRGQADAARMVVRGSSAGGFTALRALRPGGPFSAAVVAYGVTDLRALAEDTHKFESRYLDGLVGPWPEAAERYDERSPARHPEEIGGSVLLLQGEDDPVVPPDQARRMAEALRRRGLRCELELFPGEGHGFRRAESLERAARLELAFVSSVLAQAPPA